MTSNDCDAEARRPLAVLGPLGSAAHLVARRPASSLASVHPPLLLLGLAAASEEGRWPLAAPRRAAGALSGRWPRAAALSIHVGCGALPAIALCGLWPALTSRWNALSPVDGHPGAAPYARSDLFS